MKSEGGGDGISLGDAFSARVEKLEVESGILCRLGEFSAETAVYSEHSALPLLNYNHARWGYLFHIPGNQLWFKFNSLKKYHIFKKVTVHDAVIIQDQCVLVDWYQLEEFYKEKVPSY